MPTDSLKLALYRICATLIFAALTVPLLAGGKSNPWDQTNWRQWTKTDVHRILSKSPWVSNCCRAPMMEADRWTGPLDTGFTAKIMSSQTVREALVRQMQLDKRYEKLDPASRQQVDQRIAACLNEKFDNSIVVSFAFRFADDRHVDLPMTSQIHLLTADGKEITGRLSADSIETKCGTLSNEIRFAHGAPVHNEVEFPRYFVDGRPTINPADKTIRIELDFYRKSDPGNSVAESALDFNIDKLLHQGKPDF
jgi:hypothetical protein